MGKKIGCSNEYDKLRTVIVCEPVYLRKVEIVDGSKEIAIKQHHHFVSVLKDNGVEVIDMKPLKQFPEQVYTRDIGFVLGENIFVSKLSNFLRQGEEAHFVDILKKSELPFHECRNGVIEGGDVLIDSNTIFVGLSKRTNKKAAESLQTLLSDYEIVEVPFTDAYLHLDCVFNILSPTEAIIYHEEIHGGTVKALKKRYDFIEINREEQAHLATNLLSIGERTVISLTTNKNLNRSLEARGFNVIEVDYSEIIKYGGSFRCSTLPLYRENV